jgi:UDP-glucose 4-epimerase
MVVPNFVRQALSGQPITVFGDGKQSRCFTWVGDAVRAVVALAGRGDAVGQVFNIGSEEEISIADLAYLVKEKTRSSSPVVFVPYDRAYEEGFEDMPRRVPDLSKIHRLVQYQPTVNLSATLDAIIEYYRPRVAQGH